MRFSLPFPVIVTVVQRRVMSSSRIPIYRVQGTHYECGQSIGKLTREAIRQRIANDSCYLSTLFQFVQTDDGRKLHDGFVEKTRSLLPWYWDEIQGLADGAELPLEKILVLNFLNETRTAYRLAEESRKSENETGEKGCSTVLLNRHDSNILSLLHNEDHSTALYTTAYIVEADVQSSKYGDDQRESPREKFVAYAYAGGIPGNAFGVNTHGFVCALNGLYPNFVAHGRLPRQIVNRALLSVANEAELDQLLRSSPVAYGFCVNGGFIHQRAHLLNYEIGPNLAVDDANYVSKCWVVSADDTTVEKNAVDSIAAGYLVHYNHYERLADVVPEQKSLESSRSRWKRGRELGEMATIDDGMRLLGDEENKAFPIFRTFNSTDFNSVTLCTIHVNFLTRELLLYQQNPKENSPPALTYNLAELLI